MNFQSLEKMRPDISNPWKKTEPRRLVPQLIAMIAVYALGTFSRSHFTAALPSIVTKAAGDLLWTTLIFLTLGLLWTRATTKTLAIASLAISFAVEFSQLYQADWINRIRATYLGRNILGFGFHATDLLWYALGAALGILIDRALFTRR